MSNFVKIHHPVGVVRAAECRRVVCNSGAVPLSPPVWERGDGLLPPKKPGNVPRLEPCVSKQPRVQQSSWGSREYSKMRRAVAKALDHEDVQAAIGAVSRYCFSMDESAALMLLYVVIAGHALRLWCDSEYPLQTAREHKKIAKLPQHFGIYLHCWKAA